MKRLAIFDFDGTLTYKDSFLEFIKFCYGKKAFYSGMLQLSPWLIAYMAKLYPNWKAKEKVLHYFFGGMPVGALQQKGEEFAKEVIPGILRPKGVIALNNHIQAGDRVILVSASAEQWLAPWCRQLGIELLASCMEAQNGIITGRLMGENCYGPEKVSRLEKHLLLKDYKEVYVYGDSSGDKELLALATHPHYRYF